MTQENSLLFVELSARLPYHVMVKVWLKDGTTEEGFLDLEHNYADVLTNAFYGGDIKDIKPYLRPMSSMTEDEKKEYKKACDLDTEILSNHPMDGTTPFPILYHSQDYLNSIHVDYRGLIEKGLAIEVTKENNPYEK